MKYILILLSVFSLNLSSVVFADEVKNEAEVKSDTLSAEIKNEVGSLVLLYYKSGKKNSKKNDILYDFNNEIREAYDNKVSLDSLTHELLETLKKRPFNYKEAKAKEDADSYKLLIDIKNSRTKGDLDKVIEAFKKNKQCRNPLLLGIAYNDLYKDQDLKNKLEGVSEENERLKSNVQLVKKQNSTLDEITLYLKIACAVLLLLGSLIGFVIGKRTGKKQTKKSSKTVSTSGDSRQNQVLIDQLIGEKKALEAKVQRLELQLFDVKEESKSSQVQSIKNKPTAKVGYAQQVQSPQSASHSAVNSTNSPKRNEYKEPVVSSSAPKQNIIFAKPVGGGKFSSFSAELASPNHFYKLILVNETTASFELINHDKTLITKLERNTMGNIDGFIDFTNFSGQNYRMNKKGTAVRDGNGWTVKEMINMTRV